MHGIILVVFHYGSEQVHNGHLIEPISIFVLGIENNNVIIINLVPLDGRSNDASYAIDTLHPRFEPENIITCEF